MTPCRQSEDNFFSWATPGIPVEASDFDFLSQGLTGVVKKEDVDASRGRCRGAGAAGWWRRLGDATHRGAAGSTLRAADTRRAVPEAENFARMV